MFIVTDLKQWAYCPRLVYYAYCLPGARMKPTAKMALGRAANAATEDLEHRRSLRAYGLREGRREFNVWLASEALNLCGRLDMLITAPTATGVELIPVDYKDSTLPEANGRRVPPDVRHSWAVQLTAYAMLVEAVRGQPVARGFIYFIPARRARNVAFGEALRQEVQTGLRAIGAMLAAEQQPPPTPHRGRCAACEYRRLCNDI
ncbi:MAG: CRISPR-associated protein Cas4 [Candidatus Roseilinea sp.]|nr:MAG: CRISPR-associated protein Cas4 [Candidatus Roseilinea sp.]